MAEKSGTTGFRATVKLGSVDIPFSEIVALTISSALDLADSFSITLGDTDNVRKNILPKIKPHDTIDAKLYHSGDKPDYAFLGELVGHAPQPRGRYSVLSGFNAMHGLSRANHHAAFADQTDKQIVDKILQSNSSLKLKANYGGKPPDHVYKHVHQWNLSDLDFILDRAKRTGYFVLVRGDELLYQKRDPTPSGYTMKPVAWDQGEDKVMSLEHFTPRRSTSAQVTEVHVRTFNPKTRKELIGKAPKASAGKGGAQLGDDTGKDAIQQKYPNSVAVVWKLPFTTQEEGDMLAAAYLDERLLAYVVAEGCIFGDPRLKPAMVVKIANGDETFDGNYFICGVKHRYDMRDQEPFHTDFVAKSDATAKPKQT